MVVSASSPATTVTAGLAHEIVEALASQNLAPTPKAYAVWFALRTEEHAELRSAVDGALKRGGLNTELVEELYDLHISCDSGAQADAIAAGERIVRELGDVLNVLRVSGDKAESYAQTLDETSNTLEQALDARTLRDIVKGLAAATFDMAEHNRKLTDRLRESSREMDSMRALLAKARAEAMTDPLTGLANRKMMNETLAMRLNEAAVQRTPVCFLMCDIDNFKGFNDTWGHQTGDQIIRFISAALTRHALPDSLCARYGGEEFAIVLPRVSIQEAHLMAEALRSTIESKKLYRKSTNEDLGRVTISVGVAQWRPDESREALIERADACLYASKRGGRNRVTTDAQMVRRPAA